MNNHFPTIILLKINQVSLTTELMKRGGHSTISERLNLTLSADNDSNIHLSSGESLSDVDINISLVSNWDGHPELSPEDIGFLCHTRQENQSPFVHGTVLWPDRNLPKYLLYEQLLRKVSLSIESIPFTNNSEPYSWGTNREHMLHLSSIKLLASQM